MNYTLSPNDIQRYREDGVVHLRNAFDSTWIEMLRQGIANDLENPSPRFDSRTQEGDQARYLEDFWAWSLFPEFETFVRESPAAAIAGGLMDAAQINAYFDFEGTMCVLWLPLESCGPEEGIELVRGSHLWDKLFMRVFFRDHQVAQGAGWVNDRYYHTPPDINAHASCTAVPKKTVSRFTLRMTAEDGIIRHRGDWAKGERAIFEAAGHKEGDRLDSDFFPRLWPAG